MTYIPHSQIPSTPTAHKKEINSGHACTVDGCVGVRATKEASALKLVATCQVKLTPGVLRPLCRWTIEPRIRMKHPSAVTEPVFVSAAARPLSLAVLMSFSDSLGFQMHSGYFAVLSLALTKEKYLSKPGAWQSPQTVCLPEHTTTRSVLVGHLAVEVSVVGRAAGKVTHGKGCGLTVTRVKRPDGIGWLRGLEDLGVVTHMSIVCAC